MHDSGLPTHGGFANFVKLIGQGMQPFGIKPCADLRRDMMPTKPTQRHLCLSRRHRRRTGQGKHQKAAEFTARGKRGRAGNTLSPGYPDRGRRLRHVILSNRRDGKVQHG